MGGMLSSTFNKSSNRRNNSGPPNTVINVKPANNAVAINVKPNNKNEPANIPVGETFGVIPPTNQNVSNSLKQKKQKNNNNAGSNTSSVVGNGNNTNTNQEGGRRKRKTRKASRRSCRK